jgi:hypothetical protein
MKVITKVLAASVLALSVAAPAFAAEETTLLERNTYVATHADAMAYAPAPAHVRVTVPSITARDFSIASQS